MTPKRREQIEDRIRQLQAAKQEAEGHQKALDKRAEKFEQAMRSFPYLRKHSNDLEQLYAEIKAQPYYKENDSPVTWNEDYATKWQALIEPQYETWKHLRGVANEAWKKVRTIEAQIEPFVSEVLDVFSAEFNARIDAMHAYLVKMYEPLCVSQENWEKEQQLETLLQYTPRYQALLLLRKYGDQGRTAAGRISSMFSTLSKLEESKASDLAAIKQ